MKFMGKSRECSSCLKRERDDLPIITIPVHNGDDILLCEECVESRI